MKRIYEGKVTDSVHIIESTATGVGLWLVGVSMSAINRNLDDDCFCQGRIRLDPRIVARTDGVFCRTAHVILGLRFRQTTCDLRALGRKDTIPNLPASSNDEEPRLAYEMCEAYPFGLRLLVGL